MYCLVLRFQHKFDLYICVHMLCFQSVLYCIVLYNDVFTFLYVAVGNKLLLLLLLLLLRSVHDIRNIFR